mgnify:CR=1 FL=1
MRRRLLTPMSASTGIGANVAMESAGTTLLGGDLMGIVARATPRNIKQNLFFAFADTAAGIPIAAGLPYPLTSTLLAPMITADAMCLSSVSVIANALRLRWVSQQLELPGPEVLLACLERETRGG